MGTYIARRLLQMIPVVIGATFLIFTMVFALPGDPTVGKCGERPCPPAYVEAFKEEHNLNDPLVVQYAKWAGNVVQGDFGENYFGNPIADELGERYAVTAKLAVVAIAVEVIIGIAAGVLAGIRKGGFIDALVMVGTLFVISIPIIVIAPVLQWLLGIQLAWFPVTAGYDPGWYDLLLPGFVLGSLSIAYVARLTRTNLVENLRADYARTARAKGLTQKRVVGVHVLRNSLIPVVTFVGADFGALLGGAIVTERIFNIPGVGSYIFEGIANRDGIAVVSAITVLVLIFLLVNLVVDLLYGVLDPRISHD